MIDSRTARLAPLSGVAAVAMLAVSTLLINFYSYLPEPADIQEFLTDNWKRVAIGGYVGGVAAFLLFWFAGSVRATLRTVEGDVGRVSAIAFGGGVGAATSVVITYSLLLASAMRAGSDSGISDVAAVTLYDAYGMIFTGAMGVSMAVMIAAFALVSYRTGLTGKWFVWVSWIAAAGTLTPLAYIFLGFDMAWIVYVSIWLYRLQR